MAATVVAATTATVAYDTFAVRMPLIPLGGPKGQRSVEEKAHQGGALRKEIHEYLGGRGYKTKTMRTGDRDASKPHMMAGYSYYYNKSVIYDPPLPFSDEDRWECQNAGIEVEIGYPIYKTSRQNYILAVHGGITKLHRTAMWTMFAEGEESLPWPILTPEEALCV